MKGKNVFTQSECEMLRRLIKQRCAAPRNKQKGIRDQMRAIGFYGRDDFGITGMTVEIFDGLIRDGKIIVKDIDVNGTEHLKDLLNADTKVVTIFLRVPKEELEKRLQDRVDKPSPAEIRLRLSRFEYEESRINLYDYVLKNDNLEKTVQIVMTILENEMKLLEQQ